MLISRFLPIQSIVSTRSTTWTGNGSLVTHPVPAVSSAT